MYKIITICNNNNMGSDGCLFPPKKYSYCWVTRRKCAHICVFQVIKINNQKARKICVKIGTPQKKPENQKTKS